MRQTTPSGIYKAMIFSLALGACWGEEGGLGLGEADGICSELDCRDMVGIEVSRRDEDVFPPGDYTFWVEIDAGSPLVESCALSEDASLSCGGEEDVSVRLTEKLDTLVLRVDGVSPEQLLVSVSFGGVEVGVEILEPDYEFIGGEDPDCTQTCLQGTAEMRTISFD